MLVRLLVALYLCFFLGSSFVHAIDLHEISRQGALLMRSQEPAAAIVLYRGALESASDFSQNSERAAILFNLAYILESHSRKGLPSGDVEEAARSYREALDTMNGLDPEVRARALFNLAMLYKDGLLAGGHSSENKSQALSLLQSVQEIPRLNDRMHVRILYHLADLYANGDLVTIQTRDRYHEAAWLLNKALKFSSKAFQNQQQLLAKVLCLLGELHAHGFLACECESRDYVQAALLLRRALDLPKGLHGDEHQRILELFNFVQVPVLASPLPHFSKDRCAEHTPRYERLQHLRIASPRDFF